MGAPDPWGVLLPTWAAVILLAALTDHAFLR